MKQTSHKTLIHCAFLCEALPIIEYFKLKKEEKYFLNDKLLVVISGIGKENTKKALNEALQKFHINKALNVGIAGCKDKNVKLGSVFCVNKSIDKLEQGDLTTVDEPTKEIKTLLADMEASAFEEIFKDMEYYIIKIVSDYLEEKIPKKQEVSKLIRENFHTWKHLI